MQRIIKFLKQNDEILGIVVGIITSLAVISKTIDKTSFENLNINLLTDSINIGILLLALALTKGTPLFVSKEETKKICSDFNLSTESFNSKIVRTNSLINQLSSSIRWFAIILLGFYCLQFFMDFSLMDKYDDFENSLKNNKSILELLKFTSDGLQSTSNLNAAKFLGIEILTNSSNLFSATFLFTSFLVLFSVTLENDNKTWHIKNQIPISIAIAITVINIVFFIVGVDYFNLKETSTSIRLLGGIYNGIAMALLFSRFISMEYYFQNSKRNLERSFYYYGITIGLPLYVVVQPLYALFNAVDLEAAAIFKSIVFLICFWGKLVFLFFIYTMLNKKWIHSYILLNLIENENLEKLSLELNDVEKLDK
ncbi:hypothetical protein [Flavivirga eckloniae]|uniref:Uncharacterized protein n=1 Tax=Flavivirga eckloniae TaxID=1803846 RepID=A0A2K9PKA4_9FLAO|nr:hypothetical protein [Flavivirga eckloniae]AUP77465.1 hypothetical protein C1H87_01500 [Flavivirga eckloniae]